MKAVTQWLLGSLLILIACPVLYGQALPEEDPAERVLRNHAGFLNELSDRRRLNSFFPNEQSVLYGVPIRYVNSSRGNLTFVRRDLVTVGRIPIVFARVYDSSLRAGSDFGPGWHLSLAESIVRHAHSKLTYIDDSASELSLVRRKGGYGLSQAGPTNIESIEAHGGAVRVVHRDGWTKQFSEVDGRFLLAEIRDRHGNTLTIHYRGAELSRIETDDGRYVAVERDLSGRISRITDDQRRTVSYTYGPRGALETVTDLGGNQWRYEYDRVGYLERVIDPRNVTEVAATFDSAKRVKKVAILGSEFAYKYAAKDTFITDDANRLTRVSHSRDGIATSITSPNGLVSKLVLDERNRVTTLLHNGSARAAFTYNSSGQVDTVTRFADTGAIELTYKYEYDDANRPTWITGTDGSSLLLEYNEAGDLLRKTELDETQEFDYSPHGDLRSITESGTSTLYTHNSHGQVETVEGTHGLTRLSYFPDGKLKAIEFVDGAVHEYRYNSLGFRERVERNDGSRTIYQYDVTGNLIRSDGHKHTADSEAVGQTFEINDYNQPEIIRFSNGDIVKVTYDATGNPETITTADPEAPALEYLYDATNRLVAVQDGDTISGSYIYEETEPDLRLQMDYRTMRVATGAVRQSASLGDVLSIVYTRPYGLLSDSVQFDEATRAFDLPWDYGIPMPNAVDLNSLRRRKLTDVDASDLKARTSFDLPSNVMFVPPEYATINCGTGCVFNGVIIRGNGVSGTLSVPVGSTVTLNAFKASGSSCSNMICNWTLNGISMPWPAFFPVQGGNPFTHTFNGLGGNLVEAECECSPCDLFRTGSLLVNTTSAPPPPIGPPVTITYTTFIPLDHVRLPWPNDEYFYEADNVGSFTPGVYRVQKTLTVRTGQGITSNPPPLSHISRLFEANVPTTNLTTSGDCYRKNCSNCANYSGIFPSTPIVYQGQCMIRTAQETNSGEAQDLNTVQATLIGAGYSNATTNFVKVRLTGQPKIGVSPQWWSQPFAPAIDWDLTIELTRNTSSGATAYKVTGVHDGFPFHDIRIGGTVVWQRDPIPNGNTPQSLYGSGDVTVSAQGSL